MDKPAALYQQLDPLRPLEADETDLYVDWQKEIGPEDVKQRLVNSIAFSGGVPVTRLFTGHRGVGKTTELKRVKRILETGTGPRKLFVSLLLAEESVDLQDVQPADIVFHMARQLVADLREAGFGLGWTRFTQFFKDLGETLNTEVELKSVEIGADPVKFGLVLKDVPRLRPVLRRILENRLPTIYDLINVEVLKPARSLLRGLLVFMYQDDKGIWYDWNPVLEEAPEPMKR
ncbi:MAG: hypothetical protein KIT09_11665 [Bryobacteraceae bacterium]|nr:hypothetical protein [Bryobacteraceae bacterium]